MRFVCIGLLSLGNIERQSVHEAFDDEMLLILIETVCCLGNWCLSFSEDLFNVFAQLLLNEDCLQKGLVVQEMLFRKRDGFSLRLSLEDFFEGVEDSQQGKVIAFKVNKLLSLFNDLFL